MSPQIILYTSNFRTHFFGDIFSSVNRSISPEQKIVVYAPTYLGNLSLVIDEYLNNDTE